MEGKERYSYDYFIDGAVFIDTENDRDMDMDTVCSLLNKQDKRIKELEKENQQLKQQLALTEKALELACANLYDINFQLYNTEMNFVDYFKQQAEKEMTKSD